MVGEVVGAATLPRLADRSCPLPGPILGRVRASPWITQLVVAALVFAVIDVLWLSTVAAARLLGEPVESATAPAPAVPLGAVPVAAAAPADPSAGVAAVAA